MDLTTAHLNELNQQFEFIKTRNGLHLQLKLPTIIHQRVVIPVTIELLNLLTCFKKNQVTDLKLPFLKYAATQVPLNSQNERGIDQDADFKEWRQYTGGEILENSDYTKRRTHHLNSHQSPLDNPDNLPQVSHRETSKEVFTVGPTSQPLTKEAVYNQNAAPAAYLGANKDQIINGASTFKDQLYTEIITKKNSNDKVTKTVKSLVIDPHNYVYITKIADQLVLSTRNKSFNSILDAKEDESAHFYHNCRPLESTQLSLSELSDILADMLTTLQTAVQDVFVEQYENVAKLAKDQNMNYAETMISILYSSRFDIDKTYHEQDIRILSLIPNDILSNIAASSETKTLAYSYGAMNTTIYHGKVLAEKDVTSYLENSQFVNDFDLNPMMRLSLTKFDYNLTYAIYTGKNQLQIQVNLIVNDKGRFLKFTTNQPDVCFPETTLPVDENHTTLTEFNVTYKNLVTTVEDAINRMIADHQTDDQANSDGRKEKALTSVEQPLEAWDTKFLNTFKDLVSGYHEHFQAITKIQDSPTPIKPVPTAPEPVQSKQFPQSANDTTDTIYDRGWTEFQKSILNQTLANLDLGTQTPAKFITNDQQWKLIFNQAAGIKRLLQTASDVDDLSNISYMLGIVNFQAAVSAQSSTESDPQTVISVSHQLDGRLPLNGHDLGDPETCGIKARTLIQVLAFCYDRSLRDPHYRMQNVLDIIDTTNTKWTIEVASGNYQGFLYVLLNNITFGQLIELIYQSVQVLFQQFGKQSLDVHENVSVTLNVVDNNDFRFANATHESIETSYLQPAYIVTENSTRLYGTLPNLS